MITGETATGIEWLCGACEKPLIVDPEPGQVSGSLLTTFGVGPQVSARVAWSGVGIDLKTGNPTPTQIRQAVQEVIRNPSYREQAERLGASIIKTTALETIAEIVELGDLGFSEI